MALKGLSKIRKFQWFAYPLFIMTFVRFVMALKKNSVVLVFNIFSKNISYKLMKTETFYKPYLAVLLEEDIGSSPSLAGHTI